MEYTTLSQQQNIFLAIAILLSGNYAKNSNGLAINAHRTNLKAVNHRKNSTVLQYKPLSFGIWHDALHAMEAHIQENGMRPLSESDRHSILSYLKNHSG